MRPKFEFIFFFRKSVHVTGLTCRFANRLTKRLESNNLYSEGNFDYLSWVEGAGKFLTLKPEMLAQIFMWVNYHRGG